MDGFQGTLNGFSLLHVLYLSGRRRMLRRNRKRYNDLIYMKSLSRRTDYRLPYCFFASSFLGGGGRGLRLSGLGAGAPSPTCSQGDRDSKLLSCESLRFLG